MGLWMIHIGTVGLQGHPSVQSHPGLLGIPYFDKNDMCNDIFIVWWDGEFHYWISYLGSVDRKSYGTATDSVWVTQK